MSLILLPGRGHVAVVMGAIPGLTSALILGKNGIPMSETDVHKGDVL